MCRALQLAPSGYYKWRRGHESVRAREDRRLIVELRAAHALSRHTYGARRLHVELQAQGIACGRHRVRRLMKQAQIEAVSPRKRAKWKSPRRRSLDVPDLLQRQFTASRPDEVWVADITEFTTGEGTLYLAAIVDLYARRVVGWHVAPSMHRSLVIEALNRAVQQRGCTQGLIQHSDRGSQYTSEEYLACLSRNGMVPSFSAPGQCLDNAAMESFFGTLKNELLGQECFSSHEEARRALFSYIEVFYNRQRRHSTLGYRTPVEHETRYLRASMQTRAA